MIKKYSFLCKPDKMLTVIQVAYSSNVFNNFAQRDHITLCEISEKKE